jgi:hypothetical protein
MASEKTLTTTEPNSVIADEGMVYCRFPSGEIQAVDASPMELMKKINRGIQVLNDYGQFGSSVYYMDHPYEPLFQAGGAHELSVEQVINLGYHHHPPIVPTCEQHVGVTKEHLSHVGRPGAGSAKAQGCWRGARAVRFPQLDGIEVPEAPEECEYCGRDDLATVQALKQHQAVMHNDRQQQQLLGAAIVSGLQQTGVVSSSHGGVDVQTIASVVAATLETMGYGAHSVPQPVQTDDDEDLIPREASVSDAARQRRNEYRRQHRAAARAASAPFSPDDD